MEHAEKNAPAAPPALLRPLAGSSAGSGALPAESERAAVRRLGFVAAASTAIGLVGVPMSLLRQANLGVRAGTERPLAVLPIGIALSVALLLATRSSRLSPKRVLDLGLVYLVAMCGLASVFIHALPYAASDVVRGVSPIVPAVVFFAIVVSVQPRKMAIAAAASVLADVGGLLFAIWRGAPVPPWNLWLWLFTPDLVAVPIALASSRMLFTIGEKLRELRELGSYRLVERLGAGGMGEVWRAEHRTLRRPAAVKLVKPEMLGGTDPESRARVLARFELEARATASLTSPHTIEVYDYGVASDGSLYYVMELVRGLDLESLARAQGELPPARVVHFLRQLCLSLRDAHAAGLVHRDVKPANVIACSRGGERDFVKLLDFGLVARTDRSVLEGEGPLTLPGGLAGTPGYIAPEVMGGDEVDGRADLYAVGCVAYKLLTGRLVFERQNHYGLILAHMQDAPEPVRAHAPGTPAELDAIVLRLLAKPPDDRFRDADAVIVALDALGLRWTEDDAKRAWESLGRVERAEEAFAPTLVAEPAGAPGAAIR